MSWIFAIKEGEIISPIGEVAASAYSGAPGDVNNPSDVAVAGHGPIPPGWYTMTQPRAGTTGPYSIPLTPDADNIEYDRSDFLIHGDLIAGPPESASHGCIITSRPMREQMWDSGDHRLRVIASSAELAAGQAAGEPGQQAAT